MIDRGEIHWGSEKGRLTNKPRPLLVVQSPRASGHSTVTVCFLSSTIGPETWFRLGVDPDAVNGLEYASQIQIDRLFSFAPAALERRIGRLIEADLARVDAALRRWLHL